MLAKVVQTKLSIYRKLYDIVVPKNNLLRRLNDMDDFKFADDLLEGKYSLDNGRTAEPPSRLLKYCLLKQMYRLSDVDLVERSHTDLSFKLFLGYDPEDDVISPSLLTKFRKLRLNDEATLDLLIEKTVEIAINKGVVKKRNTLIVDSTHTLSRYINRKPTEILQEQAKYLRKAVYKVNPEMKDCFPKKIQGGTVEENIDYCERLLDVVESETLLMATESVKGEANYLREMVSDNLEHLNLSADVDAKVGHKTADSEFFGFKVHLAMTDERLVTGVTFTSGEKHDGKQLKSLVEKSRQAGIDVAAVVGDGAYSEKDNIDYANDRDANKEPFALVSRLNPNVANGARSKSDRFEFNKDAEMFVCKAGHMAISKVRRHNKQEKRHENPRMVYSFDVDKCKRCPIREGCYKEGNKSKTYSVSIVSDTQNAYKALQETPLYKELAGHRYKIEAKNSELKNSLGLRKAYSSGIQSMRIQGVSALIAANLKRIIKLEDEKVSKK